MKSWKCDECKGNMSEKRVDFIIYGVNLGKFEAKVCDKCGETIFEEKTSDKIDQIAKEKGLWGLAIKTKVNQLGSSIAITVNKKLANFIGLKRGEEVFIHPENKKRIIIEVR